MSEDLNALFPGQIVVVKGEALTIEPFDFVTLVTRISKLARSFAGTLANGATVLDIIADGGEDLLKIVQIAVKKPVEWFDGLPADEGLALAVAVLTVNKDFFLQKLGPQLESLASILTGAPSSSSLPSTDTPSTELAVTP